jgi:hypothetical protein
VGQAQCESFEGLLSFIAEPLVPASDVTLHRGFDVSANALLADCDELQQVLLYLIHLSGGAGLRHRQHVPGQCLDMLGELLVCLLNPVNALTKSWLRREATLA